MSESYSENRYPHKHLANSNIEASPETVEVFREPMSAQVIDIQRYLHTQDPGLSSPETIQVTDVEVVQPPKTLQEKRLESIFAVAIGSIITMSILPAVNNIDDPKISEGVYTGVLSLVGWGIFYASIPYIQESRLGKISFRKKSR